MTGNRLQGAASPYLRQHKDNPVNWWQWSSEALQEAKNTGKPILLSIGYAACHWCHVMAHESFEDIDTAQLMNQLFVNIKVDREERPDVDQLYMAALHAMGEHGGWPLTMFLTPQAEPFWGGTYFPKTAGYGRPSFINVLQQVSKTYHADPVKIASNVTAIKQQLTSVETDHATNPITLKILDKLAHDLLPHIDTIKGGIAGAPKFPNTPVLELLWRAADRTGNHNYRIAVLLTLENIFKGGIHDHLGGGFSRYSVDENWLVPHFEKMLYDNAQLLELYILAWQHTGSLHYKQAAEGIVHWLTTEMMVDNAAFASSLDADSEGIEGKYYCWTMTELEQVLGPSEAELLASQYGATRPGNWTDPHTAISTNILNLLHDPQSDATVMDRITKSKINLTQERKNRIPPQRDDKILADWNALMINALARAARVFERDDWLEKATKCFHYVIESMTKKTGSELRIAHSLCAKQLIWPGMASDYVQLTRAALTLHEIEITRNKNRTNKNTTYIMIAEQLAESAIKYHTSPAGAHILNLAANDASDIIYRTLNTADDPVPNPNSPFISALLNLFFYSQKMKWKEAAHRILEAVTPLARKNPFGHASFLNAIDAHHRTAEITISGNNIGQLLEYAESLPFLYRIIDVLDDTVKHNGAEHTSPLAVICMNETCSLPITDASKLREQFTSMSTLSALN